MFSISNAICSDYALAQILSIIKRIIDLTGIIVPILLITGSTIIFVKATLNPDDNKITKKIGTAIASAVITLLLPFIINTVMEVISTYGDVGINENGQNTFLNISACWNNSATTNSNMTPTTYTNKSVFEEFTNMNKNRISQTTTNRVKHKEKTKTYNQVVLVGDSRFYGQSNYNLKNDKTTYIAKSGEGLAYLKQITSTMKTYDSDKAAFVINMGVNDLGNVNNYISYINSLATQLKGTVYYLSVNPVDEVKEKQYKYTVKNSDIDSFNQKMKNGLEGVKYLDSNSYLKETGYTTSDGVHYTKDTYTKIYNFISSKVKS